MITNCPQCGVELDIGPVAVGTPIVCPDCSTQFNSPPPSAGKRQIRVPKKELARASEDLQRAELPKGRGGFAASAFRIMGLGTIGCGLVYGWIAWQKEPLLLWVPIAIGLLTSAFFFAVSSALCFLNRIAVAVERMR